MAAAMCDDTTGPATSASNGKQPLDLQADAIRMVDLIGQISSDDTLPGDVKERLDKLRSVLESDFFSLICDVYERVYDLGNVEGPSDVVAEATGRATAAAFAAADGMAYPRIVELPKTDEGLGFNVMGGKEQNSPIYISRIIPGGAADKNTRLRRGDQLLSVNGVSVEQGYHEHAVELLKASEGTVRLVVRYAPKILEEMENRFDRQRQRQQSRSPT